jgi:hypothetical protein
MDDNDFDLLLFATFFTVAIQAVEKVEQVENTLLQDHINEQKRLCRSLPVEKTRPTWSGFCNRVSDTHFRRQFRMTRDAFANLCNILCTSVRRWGYFGVLCHTVSKSARRLFRHACYCITISRTTHLSTTGMVMVIGVQSTQQH